MWRPDRSLRGPERATLRDVDPLNRVFAEAFTDRYSRDGLVGVRVPQLNPAIWRYALEDAGDGAMVWRDAGGELVGFNMVHRSGTEGWMGPLAVRPERQGEGLGSSMVLAGIDWLKAEGARTIGLETMPRTVDNIGFYSRLGFMPGHLTITLVRDVARRSAEGGELLSGTADVAQALADCRTLTQEISAGIDFTRELALTHELRIGDTCLIRRGGGLAAFALALGAACRGTPQGRAPGAEAGGAYPGRLRPRARVGPARGCHGAGPPGGGPLPERPGRGLSSTGRPGIPGPLDRPPHDSPRLCGGGAEERDHSFQLGDLKKKRKR
jgi:GNAT superfamily N-acetyltransferase